MLNSAVTHILSHFQQFLLRQQEFMRFIAISRLAESFCYQTVTLPDSLNAGNLHGVQKD
jgi:hypothetical protein